MRQISSIHHPLVSQWVQLRDKKNARLSHGQVFVQGIKLVRELCDSSYVEVVIVEEGRGLTEEGWRAKEVILVSRAVMNKISSMDSPEGVAAIVPMPRQTPALTGKALVVLDRVSDPGNMGTLLRSALALGWAGAFVLEGSCDPFNDKALRAARGATFRLDLFHGTWPQLYRLAEQGRYTALAADIEGTPLSQVSPPDKPLLVLGNEATGLSPEARGLCKSVTIPLLGPMESLNVAAAGAILMYALNLKC